MLQVVFNNNYEDQGQRNGRTLMKPVLRCAPYGWAYAREQRPSERQTYDAAEARDARRGLRAAHLTVQQRIEELCRLLESDDAARRQSLSNGEPCTVPDRRVRLLRVEHSL